MVEQTLNGSADQIKERTIGVEVFGRDPSYDTNLDHIVRTAATELRKRLATYYVDEKHRSELRMGLIPGSYIPRFALPAHATDAVAEPGLIAGSWRWLPLRPSHGTCPARCRKHRRSRFAKIAPPLDLSGQRPPLAAGCLVGYGWLHRPTAQISSGSRSWIPRARFFVAVGDHPNGPPTLPVAEGNGDFSTPIPRSDSSQTVPFADTVTIARVVGALEARKEVLIRRENSSSFSDLREGAVVLIGAFNNEWSLRLTRQLRYSLALDADKHLIYIRDAKESGSREPGVGAPISPGPGPGSPIVPSCRTTP